MGYSARGGLESATYPWVDHIRKMTEVVFLQISNQTGRLCSRSGTTQLKQSHYEPNGYNLYNMAGNVSEWTDSSYDPNAYEYVSSMNPNVLASNKRKVVRGGSWKTFLTYK
jgi:formylglycine-generating enzyme required for sulfatase activity